MKIPLQRGRWFNEQDRGEPPVMIINEAFARRYFAAEDPLGNRVVTRGSDQPCEIVGVVGDEKFFGLGLSLGLAGALALRFLLQRLLHELRARDPPSFLIVSAVLSLTALAACYLPARRASRVEPIVTLSLLWEWTSTGFKFKPLTAGPL